MEMNDTANHLPSHGEGQFRIEVADGHQGRFFDIRPLGEQQYEISNEQGTIGSIQLDLQQHDYCKNMGCALDLPLLHSIREGIQFHEQWSPRA